MGLIGVLVPFKNDLAYTTATKHDVLFVSHYSCFLVDTQHSHSSEHLIGEQTSEITHQCPLSIFLKDKTILN